MFLPPAFLVSGPNFLLFIIYYLLFITRKRQLRSAKLASSSSIGLYNPKAFIVHAALLRQGSPHCAISLTAASRRSLGRVSVPMWPVRLSSRLLIVGLVGRYPSNYLISRGPLFAR